MSRTMLPRTPNPAVRLALVPTASLAVNGKGAEGVISIGHLGAPKEGKESRALSNEVYTRNERASMTTPERAQLLRGKVRDAYSAGDTYLQKCRGENCQLVWREAAQRTVSLLQGLGLIAQSPVTMAEIPADRVR